VAPTHTQTGHTKKQLIIFAVNQINGPFPSDKRYGTPATKFTTESRLKLNFVFVNLKFPRGIHQTKAFTRSASLSDGGSVKH
jgi:hypothetical protein